MAQLEAAGMSSTQQHPLSTSSPQRPFAVEARESTQSVATQGDQATIHDFLSLCGAAADRYNSTATANHGPQQSSTTQDLLQPLQKSLIPAGSLSTHLRPNGDALGSSNPYVASNELGGGQQSYYAFGNGGFEPKENFSSKYRSANVNCGPKGHVAHTFPPTKHWQQQAGADTFYGIKRLSRAPSEEDDDEDDEDLVYSAKKDGRFQKGDNSQPMDGRSVDKGVTPRSKHSATEQRRRSKINDRFQMLRQLLPNADQKRDKASFLLEVIVERDHSFVFLSYLTAHGLEILKWGLVKLQVIEYIQMLHEKVKKHESLELTGQNQEQTKPLSWDRTSGQQDVSSNVAQDMKELPDTIGYVRSRLSPLTVMSEDGMTSPGLTCTMVQASASQAVLNFESKPVITKSIPLNFCSAPPTSIPEQASNHLRQTIMTENQSFFSQFLRHDDQAVTKARDLFSQKTEAMQPQVQQSLSMMINQHSRQEEDQRFPCSRSMDHKNVASLMFGRAEEEVEAQDRSSQVTEIRPLPGNGVNKPSIGLDAIGVPGCSEQRTEAASAKDQEAPTVLGGVINISSTYSQGILDTLTRALQSSGVDMTQATISVQIDLGNPESSGLKQMVSLPTGISPLQKNLLVSTNESEPSRKKLKVEAD